jgi:hypothetical protein
MVLTLDKLINSFCQELDPYLFNYSGHDAINHLFEERLWTTSFSWQDPVKSLELNTWMRPTDLEMPELGNLKSWVTLI